MTQNYELVYYVAQNVGIIGILEYPKIYRFVKDSIKMSFLKKNVSKFFFRF